MSGRGRPEKVKPANAESAAHNLELVGSGWCLERKCTAGHPAILPSIGQGAMENRADAGVPRAAREDRGCVGRGRADFQPVCRAVRDGQAVSGAGGSGGGFGRGGVVDGDPVLVPGAGDAECVPETADVVAGGDDYGGSGFDGMGGDRGDGGVGDVDVGVPGGGCAGDRGVRVDD